MIVAGVLFLSGFLLGFIPQFRSASALRDEMQKLEGEAKLLRARSSASLLYLELTRRNYGHAAQQAAALFDNLRGMTGDSSSPQTRSSVEKLLGQRDALTTGISKSDPEAVGLAQQMLDELHQLQSP